MTSKPALRFVASLALICVAGGCDTDLYSDTTACRDEDSKTECRLDAPAGEQASSATNITFALEADKRRWIAGSRTAMSITGDIDLSSTQLQAEGVNIPLKFVKDVPQFGAYSGPVTASLFALTNPSNPTLMNSNTFGCAKPVRWIALWEFDDGKQLALNVFDDPAMPTSEKSPGFCASYFYFRP